MGQIYIPAVNWVLLASCIGLVLVAGSSTRLAAAYGLAVTTTMVVTTLLLFVVQRERWKWALPVALLFTAFFLLIDLSFWGANLVKIPDGGWFPLVVGIVILTIMTTWKRGRQLLRQIVDATSLRFTDFAEQFRSAEVLRVPGTAVYMYSDPECTPPALLHNLEHNKVLHDRIILLSIKTNEVPYVPIQERVEAQHLENDFHRVVLCYGFMEDPDVPRDLALAKQAGLAIELDQVSYFLGRERLLPTHRPGMAIWREQLFVLMSRNARDAADFFRLPPDQVVELGTRVEM
jgi:KUP system potassium uptake protein